MIRIVPSSRLGVPNISLQVSYVSTKFQNFDRRSFHVDTANFVTYDPTSLDLDGRLLKRKKLHIFLNYRLRFPGRHDTAGRWTWHVSCRSFCITRRMWKRRMQVWSYIFVIRKYEEHQIKMREWKKYLKEKWIVRKRNAKNYVSITERLSRTRHKNDSIWICLRKNILGMDG